MKYSIEDVKTKHIGVQYLQGKLDETESIAFEEFLMEHPEVLDNIKLDQIFIETASELPKLLKEKKTSRYKDWIFPAIFGSVFAYASVFLFTIMTQPSLNLTTADEIIYLDNMRSSASVQNTVTLPNEDSQVVMVLPYPFNGQGNVTVTMQKEGASKPTFQTRGLEKTSTDEIAIIVPLGAFSPGLYKVRLLADNKESIEHSIEFVRE